MDEPLGILGVREGLFMGDIVILGAGLTGLSTAYHLEKLGLPYSIYERESRVGGLCRSEAADGFTFDYTGHLLHFRGGYAKILVSGLLRDNLLRKERNSWIYSKGVYSRYPFQSNLHGLPVRAKLECLWGLICAGSRKQEARSKNFEEWIHHSFGGGIAKHFMIPYNSKLWRVDLNEITPEWTERFVPRVNLREMLRSTVSGRSSEGGYNVVFYYPRDGGIEALPAALAAGLREIRLEREAVAVDWRAKRVEFGDGSHERYSLLVSTVPLPRLVEILVGAPSWVCERARLLRWLGVVNVNLGVERPSISDKHWVYVPERGFCFYRVGFPVNFSSNLVPAGRSSVYTEISYLHGVENPEDITSVVVDGLREMDVLAARDAVSVVKDLDLPYAYVIYDHNYRESREEILSWLRAEDIYSIGRFGGWRYSTMEDALLEGRKMAESIKAIYCDSGQRDEPASVASPGWASQKSNQVRRDV